MICGIHTDAKWVYILLYIAICENVQYVYKKAAKDAVKMEYLTIKEVSKSWGLGSRVVTLYCAEGRIEGAVKKGNLWLIPKAALKPSDGRRKRNHTSAESVEGAGKSVPLFGSLNVNEAMLSKIIEFFPYPIHVYSPDGTMVLTNEACLRVMHIPDKDHIVGKFNVLKDSILDRWGEEIREKIARSFQGELVHFQNLRMPIREIIERFETGELCFDSCYHNIICYPIYDDRGQLAYVVHVFVTTMLYDGKEEMVKAKEYIENNWLEEFDIDELAGVVNLSRYHFARLFKSNTGMTPYSYYQDVKIRRIKERLCDQKLTVAQAFRSCGVDYAGNYSRIFKAKVGMTPSQYRNSVL